MYLGLRAESIWSAMRYSVLALLIGLCSTTALGQSRTVTGNITDDTGEGLPGVNVVLKGTSTGSVSNINGGYSISIDGNNATLVISAIGFATQEVAVGARSVIDVTMELDVAELEEVVVTGYGVDQRRKTPGSVSTIKSEDLRVQPSGNVEQQLQGRVAGVTVITNGQPGTTSQVRVRGYGALGGNAPLYIVDGVPVGGIDWLSPDDIASTTVLKDATAASIYGARAAGGVIVYTTHQGSKGQRKMEVTYDGMTGFTSPGQGPGILNPQEQADWTWNAIRNAARNAGETPSFSHPQYGTGDTPVLPDYLLVGSESGVTGTVNLAAEAQNYNIDPEAGSIYQVIRTNRAGTDWYDAITRTGIINRHSIGIRGGGEGSRYYIGLGVQDQQGIVLHQRFERYNFRANSEFDILPDGMLSIGENIQLTYRATRNLFGADGGSGSSDDENVLLAASRMSPAIPVYDEFGGYAGTAAPGFNNPRNPVAELDGQRNDRGFSTQAFGNVYLQAKPVEGLTIKTSIGGQYVGVNFRSYSRRQYENSENNSSFGFTQGAQTFSSWTWTNTITYEKQFGVHRVKVLAGQEALNTNTFRGMIASGINPFSQNPDFVSLSNVQLPVVNGNHQDGSNFSSYFGKVTYDLMDKYIVDFVVRRDGSSRFGAANRYGTFPAISAAWRISDEEFMQGITWLDDLKIRGGYGIIGNSNNVDPNNQFSLFTTNLANSSYDIAGSNSGVAAGFYRNRIGNPNARWEKAVTSNVGFDALFFDGKIDFGLEFWRKDTEDLLFRVPVTVQSGGFANAPSVNVGEMRNMGIDFTIINKGTISGDIGYEITVNGGFLNNEIVAFAPGVEQLPGAINYRGILPVTNVVGEPISSFFGYDVVGIFRDDAEVANSATQADAAPGRFRFRDVDGDGEITIDDRVILGSPVPDFTGGLTAKFNYKGFDLEIFSFLSVGAEIYNISKVFTHMYPLFPGAAISDAVKDSWSFDNPTGDIPLFENASNFSTNTQSNSFYVEDGSYFRIQNLTLGYNLPASLLNNWKISRMRVTASVNNLVTITGYDGLDPSVGGNADTNFGIDLGNFPITRSFTFGVNLGF